LLLSQHDIKYTIIVVFLAIDSRVSQWRLVARVLAMQ
jgi:hypothetical protein